jgi:hypothetical protein
MWTRRQTRRSKQLVDDLKEKREDTENLKRKH